MGRHKIQIKQISNPKMRMTTFNKRKTGLFKKAYELAELTNASVTLLVRGESGKNFMFQSSKETLQQAIQHPYEVLTRDYICEYSDANEANDAAGPAYKLLIPKPNLVADGISSQSQLHKKHLDIYIPVYGGIPAFSELNNQRLSPATFPDNNASQELMVDYALASPMYFMINTPNQGPVIVSTPSGGVAHQMIFPKY